MTSPRDHGWLARLRWGFVLGEALLVVWWIAADESAPWLWLTLAIGGQALSNVALSLAGKQWSEAVLVALLLDVATLATLLVLGGGPSNPFSVVFLVQVTVAAVALRGSRLWVVVSAAVVAYASLFALADDLSAHGSHSAFSSHLEGMWIAFTVTAVGIAASVSRLASELERQRQRADSNARVMGMTTLAAGAAHELATPLATIKTVVGEIERELASREDLGHLREDLALVRAEVARSRSILDQLSVAAGELRGEAPTPVSLASLERCLETLTPAQRARVSWRAEDARAALPVRAIGQALHALVRNALDASADASGDAAAVEVQATLEREAIVLRVSDRGAGMSPETLARAGEPFFTTKDPGRGMGLGIFLVRALTAHLGGELSIDSAPGRGTTVTMRLPRQPVAQETP